MPSGGPPTCTAPHGSDTGPTGHDMVTHAALGCAGKPPTAMRRSSRVSPCCAPNQPRHQPRGAH
eukprot:3644312-Lingulodinium_polyedra.AAC.1